MAAVSSATGRTEPTIEGATGLRVLEAGARLAPAVAGLLLASLGADVARIEVPGRTLSPEEAAYYDRGRRVLAAEDAGAAAPLADVVVSDLDDAALGRLGVSAAGGAAGASPRALVRIGSLGASGPHARFRMTDLTEWASGGLAYATRRPYPGDDDRYVPVPPPGAQPQVLAGLAAASAALAAWRWAVAEGRPVTAEVSAQEVLAATLHYLVPAFVNNADVIGHPSTPNPGLGMLLPAADGHVYLRTVEAHQWAALTAWMGNPDWAEALGGTPELRVANGTALASLIGEWTATQAGADLVAEGQRRKVPIVLPRSVADVLGWDHLRQRDAWRPVTVGGRAAEGPALPAVEPASWRRSAPVTGAELATAWRRSP